MRTAKSSTKRYARKIAGALAKGRRPPKKPDLEDFAHDGEAAFETFEGLVASLTPTGDCADPLTLGYQYLLQCQLESLRFQRDRGYDRAIGMIENFQRVVANHAIAGALRGTGLSLVMSTLHQAGIPTSADLAAAIEETIEPVPDVANPGTLLEMMDSIVDACEGNAFLIVSTLAESGHGMPAELHANMAEALAASRHEFAREAAVLMLLDPEPAIRSAVAAMLERQPTSVSPISLRRLIAIRNWRPHAERAAIDKIVRAARASGIDCAGWEAGGAEKILSSGMDGSGAQTCLVVTPVGRRRRLSSILFKYGLRDAWSGSPQSKRELEEVLSHAGNDVDLITVSRAYLDRIVRHGMQASVDAGTCPPAGLLEIAEAIGGADWQPERLDWRELLAVLLAAIPAVSLTPATVTATLRASGDWAGQSSIAASWFEDDQNVARVARRTGRQALEKQAEHLLQAVLEPRREKWAALFVWTALWLREDPGEVPWQEFAILADAVANGHDLAQIPLMRCIATNTAMAMASAA